MVPAYSDSRLGCSRDLNALDLLYRHLLGCFGTGGSKNKMKQLIIGVRVLLVLLIVLARQGSLLSAQVKSSAIAGTVTDKTGAVVPNATVTVVEQETSTRTATQTTGKGEYTVPYLPIGRY